MSRSAPPRVEFVACTVVYVQANVEVPMTAKMIWWYLLKNIFLHMRPLAINRKGLTHCMPQVRSCAQHCFEISWVHVIPHGAGRHLSRGPFTVWCALLRFMYCSGLDRGAQKAIGCPLCYVYFACCCVGAAVRVWQAGNARQGVRHLAGVEDGPDDGL